MDYTEPGWVYILYIYFLAPLIFSEPFFWNLSTIQWIRRHSKPFIKPSNRPSNWHYKAELRGSLLKKGPPWSILIYSLRGGVIIKQGLRRTRNLRQCTNWKENLRICELAQASNKKNWSVHLVCQDGPSRWSVSLVRLAGPSCWSVSLVRSAGPSSWSVQLVRSSKWSI